MRTGHSSVGGRPDVADFARRRTRRTATQQRYGAAVDTREYRAVTTRSGRAVLLGLDAAAMADDMRGPAPHVSSSEATDDAA